MLYSILSILWQVKCIQSRGGQTNGQDNDPNISYCVLSTSTKCSYQQGSGPMLFVYIVQPHSKENLPLLWYLGNWGNQVFCEIFRTQTPYPETSLTLEMPRDIPLAQYIAQHTAYPSGSCPMAQGLQENAIQPRETTLWPRDFMRLPYSQKTAPTVSPAYPVYSSFRNRHAHGIQHTQPSGRPQGPHRLQDCIASKQRA